MKLLAILLLITSVFKILLSLKEGNIDSVKSVINFPLPFDINNAIFLIKVIIGTDGIISLICGLFILSVL